LLEVTIIKEGTRGELLEMFGNAPTGAHVTNPHLENKQAKKLTLKYRDLPGN